MRTIRWCSGDAPRTPRPDVRVWSCPANGLHYVRLLGSCVGVWLHWTGARTVPCTDEPCNQCLAGSKAVLKHYAAAQVWQLTTSPAGNVQGRWVSVVLQLTAEAFDSLDPAPARGDVLELARRDGRANAELLAKRYEKPLPDMETFPEAWNVKPVLLHLWQTPVTALPIKKGGKHRQGSGPADPATLDQLVPEVIPFPEAERQRGGA